MKEKIIFKIDGDYLNEKTIISNYGGLVDVFMDDESIGNLIIHTEEGEPKLNLEFFIIKQRLRAKGYGTKIMQSLKLYAKSLGFKTITGTCSDDLIYFYKKFGAYFEDKMNPTYPHITNKFYIEL